MTVPPPPIPTGSRSEPSGAAPAPPASRRQGATRRILEWLGTGLLWLLGWSWRYRLHGREAVDELRRKGQPVVFLFWHSRILPLAHLHRNEGATVLISQHRDGELIARLVERRGFRTVRGSSTRGGAMALRALLRRLREGGDLAITPDGPKGPPRRLKLGALLAAQRGKAPVVLVAPGAPGGWRMRSWDRFLVPRPFSRIDVHYAPPRWIDPSISGEAFARLAGQMDDALNHLTDLSDGPDPDPVRPTTPWQAPEEEDAP